MNKQGKDNAGVVATLGVEVSSSLSSNTSTSSQEQKQKHSQEVLTERPLRRVVCQERFRCSGSPAEFECDECCSLQCGQCERDLHMQSKFSEHDRRRLGSPGMQDPCESSSKGGCRPRSRAELRCEPCSLNLCQLCAKTNHAKGRKHRLQRLATNVEASIRGPLEPAVTAVSLLLVDESEELQLNSDGEMIGQLGCQPDDLIKVVSIIGNTGDGKSHTLNHTFFNGHEVFHTSAAQQSCTVGVWAAYDPIHKVIAVDTEGLLGVTANSSQRTRLLLKVMAVSDIVIYRTRAERLHSDMYKFFGHASQAYLKHFAGELKNMSVRCGLKGPLSVLGPTVVIFHETQHTILLSDGEGKKKGEMAEMALQRSFQELNCVPEAFSSIQYVGTRTFNPPTDFGGLLYVIEKHLENNSTRAPRHPSVVYKALEALSERFCGEIPLSQMSQSSFFPDEYFSCPSCCLSCEARCRDSMNHGKDGVPHSTDHRCKYTHQYDNRVLTCKQCYENGREVIVVPKTSASCDSQWLALAKYAWSGFVLECPNCGVIYRSRQFWYGNQDPEDTVIRTEIIHVWQGVNGLIRENHNAAQRLLDGVNLVAQSVSELSSGPTRIMTDWLTDQIAPSYWKANHLVTECYKCKRPFQEKETKHHCRACGEGFCSPCSSHTWPVPERGWGSAPVRVCQNCFHDYSAGQAPVTSGAVRLSAVEPGPKVSDPGEEDESSAVMARKVGEAVQSTLGVVATAIDYPLGLVKDVARPSYWIPDQDIMQCTKCKKGFGSTKMSKHHCRACGQGFCNTCSAARRPVPTRGWDHPVRVCLDCNKRKCDL
uniref:Zinc finger, FYVE domain containing 1 n=1 Tax=Eptatretus burgeri TaxID=7764 RepID=A0A8C4Q453_EPTBU